MQDSESPHANWFWSQRGTTMGPIDFEELQRLVGVGSITPSTWVHPPTGGQWVPASTVTGLFDSAAVAAAAPPDAPPSFEFCRRCGARNGAGFTRCSACGRATATQPIGGLDPKLAAIICRGSVLCSTVAPVLCYAGPLVVWAIAAGNPALIREAKASLNCHLTMLFVALFALFIGLVGLLFVIGPFIAAGVAAALFIYAIVVGVLGLLAAAKDQPFEYPWTIRLFT